MISLLIATISALPAFPFSGYTTMPGVVSQTPSVIDVNLRCDTAIELIYKVADITHENIILQGSPRSGHVELFGNFTKDKLYDKVGEITGFKWRLGKSKFVLFEKDFKDELDLPEVNFPELIYSLNSSRRLLATYFTPDPHKRFTYDMFASIYKSLPADQQELAKRGGMPLSKLSSENKLIAAYAMYHDTFHFFYDRLISLPVILQNIDNGIVQHGLLTRGNGKQFDIIDFRFSSTNDILGSYRTLVEVQPQEGDNSISSQPLHDVLSNDVLGIDNTNSIVFRKFGTLHDVLTAVNIKYHLLTKPSSDFDKRHILVAMNSSGVSSLMAGIAELHNWSLQSEIIDKNTVLTLNYSRPPIPRDVYGLGDCIIETLPTDIRNWLFRSRSIVETNLKITAPKGSSLGSNKYLEISAERSRLRRYRQSVENQVRTTFKTLEIGPQKRVGNLPVPLRKLVYNWQLIISAAKLFDDLWDSKNIDVSYFRHPEQSFLIEENGFLGIKGPDGKSFGVRMGPH